MLSPIVDFINVLIAGAKENLLFTAGMLILGFILIVLVIQGLEDKS